MFNIQTINCMQYYEPGVIQTRSQSHNEINTHGTLTAVVNYKEAIWLILNKEKRQQGNKKEKLTESLHLVVKMARMLNMT